MPTSRRGFLKTSLAAALGLPLQQMTGSGQNIRPNIVLIMADDLGYECLSCYGSLSYHTPHLDRLAQEGVRFNHCYSTPLCTPSRVQIMTGKYNFRNYTHFGCLRPGETTFAHLLRRAGYRTCVVGKWQLTGRVKGARYECEGTMPEEAGFDEHCLWQVLEKGSRYWDPTIRQNGELLTNTMGLYGPDVFLDYARNFVRRNAAGPFFLYYPMVLVHAPYVPTPETAPKPAKPRRSDPHYFADMVAYMDKIVGTLVSEIRSLGIDRRTLVLFTGDNGTGREIESMMDGRVVRGGKGTTTDAGTHVPLIAWWPGVAKNGFVCEDLVDFTDFLPTLLDVARVPLPSGFVTDGYSFFPQIRGERGRRQWVFCHYEPRWGQWKPARYIHGRRWKVYDDGRIYDLMQDPEETKPVKLQGLDASGREEVLWLRHQLEQLMSLAEASRGGR